MTLRFAACLAIYPFFCVASSLAQGDADADAKVAQDLGRYSTEKLETACAQMSARSYVSGLTDGAWMALPGGGRTYYYRSACYQELARRTGNASWCAEVKERKTLFGDGSAVSPAQCARQVAQVQRDRAEQQAWAARHAAALQGAFTVSGVKASEQARGEWLLLVTFEGRLPGRYRLEVARLTPQRGILIDEELSLEADTQRQWTLARPTVLGPAQPPAITPLSVSLFYLPAADNQAVPGPHLTGVRNLTLSLP
ncbi:hypothetical protein CHU94_13300 [Rhodoferax sp. TH121]|uniref:hypothetical protein n=1 Tax=Rhodoferax sp. TH121 TaxID=2022803 RepID=UPI000B978BDA|nr:hypothetical protein [Rhodoferax sp. TH121]OYQ40272.1 hypothetical protein CHU94_13300 [Rhodoferax sp. TH121]